MTQQTNRKALGKGLEQLFNSEQLDFDNFEKELVATTPKNEILMIPLEEIRSNPYQPRVHFDETALRELADSIVEHGVLEPIIVKKSIKGYELVAGERRTKASRLAGLETIPAIVKEFNDEEMMELALLENIQREDLSAIEEATAIKKIMEALNLTQEEVARRFGKSRSYVTNLLGLLNLPESIQSDVMNGNISMSHARVLSKFEDTEEMIHYAEKIKEEKLSVHDLENISSKEVIPKRKAQTVRALNKTKYKVYENSMRDILGTKVMVSGNKITISFATDADLNRIMEVLNIEIGE